MNMTAYKKQSSHQPPMSLSDHKLNILLLCDYKPTQAATVVEHINAIYDYSRHNVDVLSKIIESGGDFPKVGADFPLDGYDVVIIHYSLSIALEAYISVKMRRKLAEFKGVKAVFIQDEYRFVDRTIDALNDLGVSILYTCVPESEFEKVYPAERLPCITRVNVLTGYIPPTLIDEPCKPLKKRSKHLVYRGRMYPAWHGRQGLEKWVIAKAFNTSWAARLKLSMDISVKESKRLYGYRWIKLLKNSRAVLAVESGCSVFDFDGKTSAASELYERLLDLDLEKDYAQVRDKFFLGKEDQVNLAQVSPRIFEAVAMRILLVAYEGEYSGILIPWRHYVPVKKDHSNIKQVIEFLRDDEKCTEIISNAYCDIALNPEYSYENFVCSVDTDLERAYRRLSLKPAEKTEDINGYYSFGSQYVRFPHHTMASLTPARIAFVRRLMPTSIIKLVKKVMTKIF